MSAAPRNKPVRHVICAATLALAVIGVAGNTAWAQAAATDDDDLDEHVLNADKRLFNAILGTIGLGSTGPEINYRERSPLVVPQGRDLPPPGKAAKTGDWPVEPEVKAKRAAAALNKSGRAPIAVDPAKPISGTAEANKTDRTGTWADAPKRQQEPDFFSMLLSGRLVGTWEEYGKFEGEPPRTSLVEPPPGYLTPSPTAPYGATPRAGAPEKKEKKL
jgi:hypothetical protein